MGGNTTVAVVAAATAGVAIGYLLIWERKVLAGQLGQLMVRVSELQRDAMAQKRIEEGLVKELESLRLATQHQSDSGGSAGTWRDAYNELAFRLKQTENQLKEEKAKSVQLRDQYDRLLAKLERRACTAQVSSTQQSEPHLYIPAHA